MSYIDGQKFEIFTDKEIATKESKKAIDTMEKKGISSINDLRKTPDQLRKEKEDKIASEKAEAEAAKQAPPKEKKSSDK